MIKGVIAFVIAILGVPAGYWIAWLARDELIDGRKWFSALVIASILCGIFFFLMKEITLVYLCGFMFMLSLVALMKSSDKKWTRKKI